jgi:type I restriction enzyme S subunit
MRLRFSITLNPPKSEVARLPTTTEVTFAPMEALADGLGGLDTTHIRTIGDVGAGSYSYFAEGDVLLAKVTPCFENGKKAIALGLTNGIGFATSEVHVIRPNTRRLDRRYLRYLLCSADFRAAGMASMTGAGGLRRVSEDAIRDFHLPTVDLQTQRAIADFLDRETDRIDQLIEKKQRMVNVLGERYGTSASDAVGGRSGHSGSTRDSGIDWIGAIPAHWTISRIGWLQRRITYGFTNPMPTADQGPFLLTANDINDGRILYESARHTTVDAFKNDLTDKSRPQLGDVLLTKDGTLGRVAVHDGQEVCINQSVALLRPMPSKLRPHFLAAVMESQPYQDRLIFDAGGTAIKHIYITRVAKMPFASPSLAEQDTIISEVRALRSKYVTTRNAIRMSIDRLGEFRSALITAAVTDQIDAATWGKSGTTDRRLDEIEAEIADTSQPEREKVRA